jgi:hypothetical protein
MVKEDHRLGSQKSEGRLDRVHLPGIGKPHHHLAYPRRWGKLVAEAGEKKKA